MSTTVKIVAENALKKLEEIGDEWLPGYAVSTRKKLQDCVDALNAALQQQPEPVALVEMTARKDAAYEERNKVVAALATVFPSGITRTAIEGWSEDWHGCVYIDLPTGQASWHFHDSQAHLFAGLPPYTKPWDGHDTPEKYRRLAALQQQEVPPVHIDIERMNRALRGPRILIPDGLSVEGVVAFINDHADRMSEQDGQQEVPREPGWWWCANCQCMVSPRSVTYEETHDVRAGGCGHPVGTHPHDCAASPSTTRQQGTGCPLVTVPASLWAKIESALAALQFIDDGEDEDNNREVIAVLDEIKELNEAPIDLNEANLIGSNPAAVDESAPTRRQP